MNPNEVNISYVTEPLPIFTTIFNDHVEFNNYYKKVILEHRARDPDTVMESNVKAWHSSWETHLENPKFDLLVERVIKFSEFVNTGYFNGGHNQYYILNLWAMMYEESEYAKRHCHYPAHFSGCYYVEVEEDSAPIIFESVIKDGVNDNNKPLTIQPQSGMIALWPGLVHHEVPPTKGKRMAISFNIGIGEPQNISFNKDKENV
tara:strand:- start:303 stop:914 length:612 start_codon:yes stop_codon:yes gene_type:complete